MKALLLLMAGWITLVLLALNSPAQGAMPSGLTPTVEPPTITPSPTPTATPMALPLSLAVTLQRPNSAPPSAPWAVPVQLSFYAPGGANPLYAWEVVLDSSGRWSGGLAIPSGVYDVRARNLHTLRNVRRNVAIVGSTSLDMGVLHEGDANADNTINILDFARLRNSYFLSRGAAGFDPSADFDENGTINILDFGLLRSNYFMSGDIEVTGLATGSDLPTTVPVTLTLVPLSATLRGGEVVGFTVRVDATGQRLAGLDVELLYDPAVVAVTDAAGRAVTAISPGPAFAVVIQNIVDPAAGRIAFSAANFDHVVNGVADVAGFALLGRQPGAARMRFGPRTLGSDDVGRQVNVTPAQPDIRVTGYRGYLPLLTRR